MWCWCAATGCIPAACHPSRPVPAAQPLFHHWGQCKSWRRENGICIMQSGKFEHSIFCLFYMPQRYYLNVREPLERLAHTWSIKALEPIDKMWTRPPSSNLVAGWQELWWSSATAGSTSPGGDNRANAGFYQILRGAVRQIKTKVDVFYDFIVIPS